MSAYTPTARSKVKRLHERGHYDKDTLYAILDSGFLCHVGYAIGGRTTSRASRTSAWRPGA